MIKQQGWGLQMGESLMSEEAKTKCFNGLAKLVTQITELMVEVSKVNPNEEIGEARRKMVQTMNFADDVCHYGQMVLDDDLHAIYSLLRESFAE